MTGTDADLRKLSKEDIKIKLIQMGYDEEEVRKFGRWKGVSLLRDTSSHAVKLGYNGDIVKYARNQRYNTQTQREAYQSGAAADGRRGGFPRPRQPQLHLHRGGQPPRFQGVHRTHHRLPAIARRGSDFRRAQRPDD